MARPEESLIGRTIAGKFAIDGYIGAGAMGQVYRARQIALDKTVALKVLHQDLAGDETFAARFQREALAASRLDHPNSMRVIDFGAEPDGMLYIAMEFLDGRDLHHVIHEDGPLPERRSVDILTQTLSALIVAHDMGVVHRDLKPENIMILEGADDEGNLADLVKVCDFGIAKINNAKTFGGATPARGPLTTQGLVVGTPEYMSPEQGRGDPLDARSDLYSVGVILFQLLTGRVPFQAETALGLVFKQVNELPPLPSSIRADVDPHLESVCLKALSKRPDDRYQTAREMRSALRVYFGEARMASGPITVPARSDRSLERADTVGLPSSPPSNGFLAAATTSQIVPARTATGTAALPALPVSRPNVWLLGGAAIVVGAGITAVGLTRWAPSTSHADPAVDLPVPSASASAPSAPALSASASAASVASAAPKVAPRVASAAPTQGLPAAKGVARPLPSATAALAPLDSAPATFSLATALASPTVTRVTGVSAREVRAGLPTWAFTQCYRTGLEKANKALDGHVVLGLTIDASGAIKKVTARGPAPLLSVTGDCLIDAVGRASVTNGAGVPGTADVDIACTPR